MSVPKRKQVPVAVSDEEKKLALAVMSQNKTVLEELKPVLPLERVEQENPAYSEFLGVIYDYHDKTGVCAPVEVLAADVERRIVEAEGTLTEADLDELRRLVRFVTRADRKKLNRLRKNELVAVKARETVKAWMMIETLNTLKDRLASSGHGDYEEAISKFQEEQLKIDTLDAPPIEPLFADGWVTEREKPLTSTGIPTFDRFTGGGLEGGESLLFMGPFGSCKTLLATQATCTMAKDCVRLVGTRRTKRHPETRNRMRPVVLYVSTETSRKDFLYRAITHLTGVPRERQREANSNGGLNYFHDNPQPTLPYESQQVEFYRSHLAAMSDEERLIYSKLNMEDFVNFKSERTRVRQAMELLNQFVVFIELTESNEKLRSLGGGGIADVQDLINGYLRSHPDHYIYSMVFDHISGMAQTMMRKGTIKRDHLRHVPRELVNQISSLVAKRFGVPALVFHQLSGESNKRARNSTAMIDHTDGSECKSVAEFADYAVQTTMPDSNGFCRFHNTKYRRTGAPQVPTVIQVQGAFQRVVDRSFDTTIHDNAFVSRDELQELTGAAPRRSGSRSSLE